MEELAQFLIIILLLVLVGIYKLLEFTLKVVMLLILVGIAACIVAIPFVFAFGVCELILKL